MHVSRMAHSHTVSGMLSPFQCATITMLSSDSPRLISNPQIVTTLDELSQSTWLKHRQYVSIIFKGIRIPFYKSVTDKGNIYLVIYCLRFILN
jgi:hypothetical protein